MNKTPREAIELIETLKPLVSEREDVEVVFCPPFISLMVAVEAKHEHQNWCAEYVL